MMVSMDRLVPSKSLLLYPFKMLFQMIMDVSIKQISENQI